MFVKVFLVLETEQVSPGITISDLRSTLSQYLILQWESSATINFASQKSGTLALPVWRPWIILTDWIIFWLIELFLFEHAYTLIFMRFSLIYDILVIFDHIYIIFSAYLSHNCITFSLYFDPIFIIFTLYLHYIFIIFLWYFTIFILYLTECKNSTRFRRYDKFNFRSLDFYIGIEG